MFSKKKKIKDPVLLEAKHFLLNRVEVASNGHLVALKEWKLQSWGAADGAQKVKTLGIKTKHFIYDPVHINNTKAVYEAGKIMNSIGRMVDFQTKKDSVASLVKLYIFYPTVLLFFENEDKELQLTIFTPRSITGALAVYFSRRRFEKELDDLIERNPEKKAAKQKEEPKEKEPVETDGLVIAEDDGDGKKGLFRKKKVVYVPYDFEADELGSSIEDDKEPELADDEEEYWDGRNWVVIKKDEYDD